jgi:hypothetical protein
MVSEDGVILLAFFHRREESDGRLESSDGAFSNIVQ